MSVVYFSKNPIGSKKKNNDNGKSMEFRNEICQLPNLDYGHELKNMKPMPKCKVERNWGKIDSLDHKWTIDKDIRSKINSIKCKYRKIERIDDFKVKVGIFTELNDGDFINDDVFEVECDGRFKSNNEKVKFDNLYVQIVDKNPNQRFNIEKDRNDCFPYNVMLLSYDSVSRVSFTKRLKKTFDFIKKKENFFVLTGYNIVGDGTPQGN